MRKFIIKIESRDLKKIYNNLGRVHNGEKLSGSEAIAELFYLDSGRWGEVDIRKNIKVEEVK